MGLNFSSDCVAISKDIAKYGFDVRCRFLVQEVNAGPPATLSLMRSVPKYIYTKPPTYKTSPIVAVIFMSVSLFYTT